MGWRIDPLHRVNIGAFAELMSLMHVESGFSRYALDIERAVYVILTLAETEQDAYVRELWRGDQLVGGLVGEIQQHPFVDMRQAVDHAFYVRPEHRVGTGAARLVRDFEKWARGRGADRLQLSAAAGIDNVGASRFLAAVGVPSYGAVHVKELR